MDDEHLKSTCGKFKYFNGLKQKKNEIGFRYIYETNPRT